MKWTIGLVALLGILAALCMAVLVAFLMARPALNRPAADGEVTILVAAHDIPQLALVDSSAIELRKVPRNHMPEQALTVSVEAVGKIMAVPAVTGQAFRKDMFVTEGAGAQLAASLPEGKRAVAISVSEFGGLEGILYPGSVVDVILTVKGSTADDTGVARTVLERVPVLAVEQQTVVAKDAELQQGNPRGMGQNTRRVTLLVDSRQAGQLQLAQSEGILSLALRNPLDRQNVNSATVTMSSMIPSLSAPSKGPGFLSFMATALARSAARPAAPVAATQREAAHVAVAPAPAPAPTWQTTILHGTQVEKIEFPEPADTIKMGLRP